MGSIPNKIKFAMAGALIVPCFGRFALHGTGHEHDYYRYLVPFFVGGLAGFLIGFMKDKWLVLNRDLRGINRDLEVRIRAQKRAEEALRESEERYRNLFIKNHSVILLIDPDDATIVDANPAAIAYYGWSMDELKDKKITQINMLTQDQVYEEMERARSEKRSHFIFKHCLSNGEVRDVEVFSGPINFRGKKLLCSIVHDITDRVIAETEREKLIKELQDALKEIKTLRGIIPICSHCKKVRNDTGAWDRLDEYIAKKSNAEFSHGICPECAKQLYPGYNI
jgi:PAS domain S-box-containing protein